MSSACTSLISSLVTNHGPIAGHEHYRQIVLQVLNAAYVIQYRAEGERVVILRVFHGREARTAD